MDDGRYELLTGHVVVCLVGIRLKPVVAGVTCCAAEIEVENNLLVIVKGFDLTAALSGDSAEARLAP